MSSSATPANRSPPITTPPAEYIKRELSTFHPRTKDLRALAASSTSIVFSTIASSSYDPTDSAPNEPGSSKELGWKTAYGAAKMAVEIAKESSDMFLPLKAVVGAISVLIKNYDQMAANAEQIRDIEERVQSLGKVLASPVREQDGEEKARREDLRKKLAGIIAKLRPLSEKNGLVKFLNNVDRASTLSGFVQDLANAVTDYQTSIQQSIYENTKKIDDNAKDIRDNTRMIHKTTSRTDNTTNRIRETTNRTDHTINRIDRATERTREATERIDETTQRIDENTQNIIDTADLQLLERLDPVYNAGYKAGHHDMCLRGTRESVLDEIMRWAKDPQERHVFWLNGLAGTGKSTIAQTFSEMVAQNGTLGASFFCSRDYLDRKELKNIFPTLAYQLACQYPSFRSRIIRVIKRNPSVARSSLIYQLKDLIIDPLSSVGISCAIVIDALDECVDDQPSSAILSVLGRHVKHIPTVKFFITGRPETRIRNGFRLPLLEPLTQIFLLHEVKLSSVDQDIRLYLQEKLSAHAKERSDLDVLVPWPRDDDLTALTKKSSGLFIFASTVIRFIESEYHDPSERLQLILTPPESTVHEGLAGIDQLYAQVLTHAFSNAKAIQVFSNLRKVLGAVILAFNPLSRAQIAEILDIKTSVITTTLRHLHSVLLVPNEESKEIRIFHKSFPDFLQDLTRCSEPRFFIDTAIYHGDMALGCLKLLKRLKRNPCNLPNFVMNRDVVNLPELLEDKVGSAVRYACAYWTMHARSSPTTRYYALQFVASATLFFEYHAVQWIEVMSLENRLESVIHSIHHLFDWISTVNVDTSNLRNLAQDCLRFTMYFFHPIQQSAPHIYHSALPLSPRSSLFHSMTLQQETEIAASYGGPGAWGVVLRTIKGSSGGFTCITTFGRWIAAACDGGTVEIYDSVTGVLRQSLSPADPAQKMKGSPDGSLLFCTHQPPSITSWDIQTGGLIHTLVPRFKVECIDISLKGHYLAYGLSQNSVKIWDITNRKKGTTVRDSSPASHLCWLKPEEELLIAKKVSVHIINVVSRQALVWFNMEDPICGVVYSQKFNNLAIVTTSEAMSTITIINPWTGKPLTYNAKQPLSYFTFSQATEELVCCTKTGPLESLIISTGFWRPLDSPTKITSICALPNRTLVVNTPDSFIQQLSLEDANLAVYPFDQGNTQSRQLAAHTLAVHPSDQGNILSIFPTGDNRTLLLELDKMSKLFTIYTREDTFDSTIVLCASHKHRVAVCYSESRMVKCLESRRFCYDPRSEWTVAIDCKPSLARISPDGSNVVTLHREGYSTCIDVRCMQTGVTQARRAFNLPLTLDITFDSETRFCFHHDRYRVSYDLTPLPGSTPPHQIQSLEPQPADEPPHMEQYHLDESHEWIVNGSKKICWIPPGYIKLGKATHCWAGRELVMVGQDGELRKLKFRS